jgi:glycolate oxidase FAD binding subunit
VHRLATGSLGTLGVITQVALKVRPLPERRVTIEARGSVPLATEIARRVPLAAGVLATAETVEVRLEGWHAEVDELAGAVAEVAPTAETGDDLPFPGRPWWEWPDDGTVVEASVAPSRLAPAVEGSATFAALAGVGLAWIAAPDPGELAEVRTRVAAAGGIAPAVRGPGGLGGPSPPGLEVHRRLRAAFDPAGILAPGRGWHEPS